MKTMIWSIGYAVDVEPESHETNAPSASEVERGA